MDSGVYNCRIRHFRLSTCSAICFLPENCPLEILDFVCNKDNHKMPNSNRATFFRRSLFWTRMIKNGKYGKIQLFTGQSDTLIPVSQTKWAREGLNSQTSALHAKALTTDILTRLVSAGTAITIRRCFEKAGNATEKLSRCWKQACCTVLGSI